VGRAPRSHGRSTTGVKFDTGHEATLVRAGPGTDVASLITALGLEGRVGAPLLLVSSGTATLEGEALARTQTVFTKAVAPAGALTTPTVVDGGVARGISTVAGATRAGAPDAMPVLLGVVPAVSADDPPATSAAGTPLEHNHTHFVVSDAAQSEGETDLLFALAAALGGRGPIAMLLAGGDEMARLEALHALERGWPILVIAGTGGIADAIADEWLSRHDPPATAFGRLVRKVRPTRLARLVPARLTHRRAPALKAIADQDLRRLVGGERVRVFARGEPPEFGRQIAWELQDEPALKEVWRTFASYDALAVRVRRTFERFQNSILLLGVLATLLALLASATRYVPLHWAAVAAPIVVSTVIALANRLAAGKRWVVLRAAAESIKTEIYRYRTRTGQYADDRLPRQGPTTRAQVLAQRITHLDAALMHTDASGADLAGYAGPLPPVMYGASRDDDGLSRMDAPTYLRLRLGDQVAYFEARVKQLDRRRTRLQVLGVGAGGAGAIVAAAGAAVWVGLTTAISGAALSYLGYLQVDNTIVTYNQSKARLRLLDIDWKAQNSAVPDPQALERLVAEGEAVLSMELSGWVRQMSQTVDRAQAEQEKARQAGSREAPAADGAPPVNDTPPGQRAI
jgi:hypothetical protein